MLKVNLEKPRSDSSTPEHLPTDLKEPPTQPPSSAEVTEALMSIEWVKSDQRKNVLPAGAKDRGHVPRSGLGLHKAHSDVLLSVGS